jgi:hypothetical protein
MRMQVNCVCAIRPNKYLSIREHALRLSAPADELLTLLDDASAEALHAAAIIEHLGAFIEKRDSTVPLQASKRARDKYSP